MIIYSVIVAVVFVSGRVMIEADHVLVLLDEIHAPFDLFHSLLQHFEHRLRVHIEYVKHGAVRGRVRAARRGSAGVIQRGYDSGIRCASSSGYFEGVAGGVTRILTLTGAVEGRQLLLHILKQFGEGQKRRLDHGVERLE